MNPIHPASLLLAITVTLAGCGGSPDFRDQRLAEFAQQSVAEQAKQNEHLARQSQAVIEESRQLAEAAHDLVEQDATARRELVAAHESLQSELNEQRATIDIGRDQLEQERREIAKARHREPIIAAALENLGLMIACLLPLAVCAWVLWLMTRTEPDDRAAAELLAQELTADEPLLFERPVEPGNKQLPAAPQSSTKSIPTTGA